MNKIEKRVIRNSPEKHTLFLLINRIPSYLRDLVGVTRETKNITRYQVHPLIVSHFLTVSQQKLHAQAYSEKLAAFIDMLCNCFSKS